LYPWSCAEKCPEEFGGGTYLFSHAIMAMAGGNCVIVLLMLVVVPSDLAVHCAVHLQYPSMIYKLCEIGTKNCL